MLFISSSADQKLSHCLLTHKKKHDDQLQKLKKQIIGWWDATWHRLREGLFGCGIGCIFGSVVEISLCSH
jgi:hypothetical protein